MSATQATINEAYGRAVAGQSVMNYAAIYEGFLAKGIPESEIKPRENVFTFWAWKAVGRRVKKGEHGVCSPFLGLHYCADARHFLKSHIAMAKKPAA